MQNSEQTTQVSPASQPAEAPEPNEFEAVKARLEEIARAVDDENLPLDDALDLYEEAVKLGLQASNLLEVGIVVEEDPAEDGPEPNPVGPQASDAQTDPAGARANGAQVDLAGALANGAQANPAGALANGAQVDLVGARANDAQVDRVGAQTSAPGSPQANDDNAPSDDGVSTQL